MLVKQGPTLGWTRGSVAATIRLVTKKQRQEIAVLVRAEMSRQGLTNRTLGIKAGLAEKTISRLINARAKESPSYGTLERVGKALNIKLGPSPNADATQLDRIEGQIKDLHALFFGENGDREYGDGIAARLLEAGGLLPPRVDEPPENLEEGQQPGLS